MVLLQGTLSQHFPVVNAPFFRPGAWQALQGT